MIYDVTSSYLLKVLIILGNLETKMFVLESLENAYSSVVAGNIGYTIESQNFEVLCII